MIKLIIKYVILGVSLTFLVTCNPESIIQNLTGQEILWLCPNTNITYNYASECNPLCTEICAGYDADQIPLSWTYYCEQLETNYDTIQKCQEACPNNCIVDTDS